MKPDNNNTWNRLAETDREISAMLHEALPKANENPWFTPRLMNRLPSQSRWARVSLWQWVCYLLGIAAFIVLGVVSGRWLIHTELSLTTILTVASMSVLAVICAGIMMVPSLVRILREP